MAGARGKVALVYDSASITPLEIAEAARPVCDLVWLLDYSDPMLSPLLPLIRRLGGMIDTGGRSVEAVVADLAATDPSGVFTFAERQMPLAAGIAAAFGFPYFSTDTAALLANKYRQRLALAAAGVPGPRFWPVSAGDAGTIDALASELPFPVVLKPQVGTGSRDTTLVEDFESMKAAFDGVDEQAGDMLIEELLVEARAPNERVFGETLMVDSMVMSGRASHFVVCGHFIPAPPFRGAGSFAPSQYDAAQLSAVYDATDAAIAALGIEHGLTNTDLIYTPDGPRVLEVNGRIGGDVHTLIEMAGGAAVLPEVFRFAAGEEDVGIAPLHSAQVAFSINQQAPMDAVRLLALNGLEETSALPGVSRIVPHRSPGDSVDWRIGTRSRIATIYGVAGGHDELRELHTEIERCLSPEYEFAEPSHP